MCTEGEVPPARPHSFSWVRLGRELAVAPRATAWQSAVICSVLDLSGKFWQKPFCICTLLKMQRLVVMDRLGGAGDGFCHLCVQRSAEVLVRGLVKFVTAS